MVTFGTAQIHYQEKMVTLVRLRRNTNGTVYAAGQIPKFLVVYMYADSYITRKKMVTLVKQKYITKKNGNFWYSTDTLPKILVTFGKARIHYQK